MVPTRPISLPSYFIQGRIEHERRGRSRRVNVLAVLCA